jgi:hypothetical protein
LHASGTVCIADRDCAHQSKTVRTYAGDDPSRERRVCSVG